MSVVSWAMAAIGLFLVLYAVAFLFRPAGDKQGARRDSLGCGFVLLAGGVWSVVLAQYMGDRATGTRLGFGLALILPTLAAILRPGRRGIVMPIVLLVIAVLLGASSAPRLAARLKPSGSGATARDLEKAVLELDSRIRTLEGYRKQLVADSKRTTDAIRALGHKDFDAISGDEQGMALLEELGEIDAMQSDTDARLDQMRRDLVHMQTAVRRIRRLARAESVTGTPVSKSEMERILTEAARASETEAARTVEKHLERERLKELFEQGFGGGAP